MKLSVVSTMFFSAPYMLEFYNRISASVSQITNDYEIIFVNDASPDNALEIAKQIVQNDEKVIIIDLARNFGHHKAMMTGLKQAKGEYIFLIDSDLEESPELIVNMWKVINNSSNVDLVYGLQKVRKGKFFERISGSIFHNFFNLMSGIKLPNNISTVRLMTRRYKESFTQFTEHEIMFNGLGVLTGYNQTPYYFTKTCKGKSSYTFSMKINMAINSITSFSNKPLVLIFYLGLFITSFSFLFVLYTLIRKFMFNIILSGWTSLIASIWLLGGIMIFCIGIIGVYLSKNFIEVKKRPYIIIKDIWTNKNI